MDDTLFSNKLFLDYIYEIILSILIIYLFNFKIGLIASIFYILLYSLNKYKLNYYNTHPDKDQNKDRDRETSLNSVREPTMNNPYSNYNLNENPNLEAPKDRKTYETMVEYNKVNVYENSYDKNISRLTIGSFDKSLRDFYTTAITTYPNKSEEFANWTYSDKTLTCKEDNNCFQFDDVRFHSR